MLQNPSETLNLTDPTIVQMISVLVAAGIVTAGEATAISACGLVLSRAEFLFGTAITQDMITGKIAR